MALGVIITLEMFCMNFPPPTVYLKFVGSETTQDISGCTSDETKLTTCVSSSLSPILFEYTVSEYVSTTTPMVTEF